MSNETVEIISMDGLGIYQAEKASIDSQIATAKAFPRNLTKCADTVVALITMNKEFAEKCNYALPTAGKTIQGPSYKLAKTLAKNFGNLRVDSKCTQEDLKSVSIEAVCFDLENNYAVKVQVNRSIWGQSGRYSEHMINLTKQAGISIAFRNAVFAVVDEAIIDKCYNAAKNVIIGKIPDEAALKARAKKLVDGLKDVYSITEKEILSFLRKNSVNDLTKDDIFVLTGLATSLQSGEGMVDEIFRGKKTEAPKTTEEKTEERMLLLISNATTLEGLEKLKKDCKIPTTITAYDNKYKEIKSVKGTQA